ncbi:MAG TPA: right-handed parallel beta-helix repeat-containing protein [Kofleriaceae bacterium]|nr:right-handed parallel beta-helix repeat-containing protein [Kofleriaceae bacterium]
MSACRGTTPVCGADEACHACTADADCASQTCLPDGSCASPLDVLYVSPTGTSVATCMPDDHCSLARALALIDGTKSTIRLDPAHYDLLNSVTLPDDLHLVGRGAVLDRNAAGSGEVLDIAPGTHIALDYVTVVGGDGAAGHGILCNRAALTLREVTIQGNGGCAISSTGCQLAISHSQLVGNQDAGIAASAGDLVLLRSTVSGNQTAGLDLLIMTFDIENNIIVKNGGPSSATGGVFIGSIRNGTTGRWAFGFNTVAENSATFGNVAGVVCDQDIAVSVPMTSNIVVDNTGPAQVSGAACFWTYSDIAPGSVFGMGNRSSDPLFVDPAHNNFHLQIASPVRDAADPAATLAVDIDGDARPQGAGRDMGADEIK